MPQKANPRAASLPLVLGALAIVISFVYLNHAAYDGFFEDDDLQNLSWAPLLSAHEYLSALITPKFATDNFRPAGSLYFALMGRHFGLDFPPWITPLFALHLFNALLLFLLMKRLSIPDWWALAGAAFFTLSAAAFDVCWRPMYIFDLLCATFSLLSILLCMHGHWVFGFIAFWLAYKAKEPAVMVPAVLFIWEYWFGKRRLGRLVPFLLVSLSFGLQGIFLNPNKDNAYTFRFGINSLRQTIPFYSARFLMFPFSGLVLLALAFVRERRIWFGLIAASLSMTPLMFLPGRLVGAYIYLPLAFGATALCAVGCRIKPVWALIAIAIWMPFNVRQIQHAREAKLTFDDDIFAFVNALDIWASEHPGLKTFVFDRTPNGFRDYGALAAWSIAHQGAPGFVAWWSGSPGGIKALRDETIAYGIWDERLRQLAITIHPPG